MWKYALAMAALASFAEPAAAQYVPDIIELDGTVTLAFPPDDRLALKGGATIEFWVQPDWKGDPGYDPVILSNDGPAGPSYVIAMLRGKNGIGVISGDKSFTAPYDFSDGKMHHVTVIDDGKAMEVRVDNRQIAYAEMTLASLPSYGLWIGSVDGDDGAFTGAIAGLRIWDVALDPAVVAKFATIDVLDSDSDLHPQFDRLVGASDFAHRGFLLQDYGETGSAK